MAFQVLQGFVYFHSYGIVHRDIKPDNIFIDGNNDYVIGDFGAFKGTEETSSYTKIGTMLFMAPETLQANSITDSRADVYGLGVILYYAANKKTLPYIDSNEKNIKSLMETGKEVKLHSKANFNKNYSSDLIGLCYSMLEYFPNNRISSIEALFSNYFEKDIKEALQKAFPINEATYFMDLYKRFGSMKASDLINEIRQRIPQNRTEKLFYNNRDQNNSANSDYIKGIITIDYIRTFYLEQNDKLSYNEQSYNIEKILEMWKTGKLESTYICFACEIEIYKGNEENASKIIKELLPNINNSFQISPYKLENLLLFRVHLYFLFKFDSTTEKLQNLISDYIRENDFWSSIYSKVGKYTEVARTMNLIGLALKKCQIYGKLTLNAFKSSQQIFAKIQGYTHNLEAKTFLDLFEIYFDRANFSKALINLKLAYDYFNCFRLLEKSKNVVIEYKLMKMKVLLNLLTLYILTINEKLSLDDETYFKYSKKSFSEEIKQLKYIDQIDMRNRRAFLYANSTNVNQGRFEFGEIVTEIKNGYSEENKRDLPPHPPKKNEEEAMRNKKSNSDKTQKKIPKFVDFKYDHVLKILKMNYANSLFLLGLYATVWSLLCEIIPQTVVEANSLNLYLPLHYLVFNLENIKSPTLNVSFTKFAENFEKEINSKIPNIFINEIIQTLVSFSRKICPSKFPINENFDNSNNTLNIDENICEPSTSEMGLKYYVINLYMSKQYFEAISQFKQIYEKDVENKFCQQLLQTYSSFLGFLIYLNAKTEVKLIQAKMKKDKEKSVEYSNLSDKLDEWKFTVSQPKHTKKKCVFINFAEMKKFWEAIMKKFQFLF